MAHKFIGDIESGEQVKEIYVVSEPILRSTTRGDLYIAMYLSDRTGRLNGRMWQATEEAYKKLPKPGFIHVDGRSELYQNSLQIVVNNFSVIDASRVSLDDFLPSTDKDTNEMFKEVQKIVEGIKPPQLKALIDEFLADKELMKEFCRAPAAVKMHHNYLGGLLEHTLSMLHVAERIFPLYPQVQKDLVLAGIFLHDMGKTKELCYDTSFSYTDSGQLIGHIAKTLLMVHEKAGRVVASGHDIDKAIMDALGHIILSHHGQYDFGSPKLPATIEAFMVNYIDDLDAKMCQVTSAIDNDRGDSNWTAWQNTLQTRLYRKPVL